MVSLSMIFLREAQADPITVGMDPELRLHRIGSGPTFTSGDVVEKNHAAPAASPEFASSDSDAAEPISESTPAPGGGRHDQ